MKTPVYRFASLFVVAVLLVGLGRDSYGQAAAPDAVRAGRYDNGKMWTFEYPPIDYLAEVYDFHPDDAWFERARLSVLRLPGCSASFVSPNGLVVTNHHCVRGRVSQVSRPGENLLDNGFYAPSVAEERPIPGYYADQLVAIEDVTDEVYAALEGQETDAEREQARQDAFRSVQARIAEARAGDIRVQIIGLYDGGRYSAYVFKRYEDVRLVAAAELQLGFFGGDPDNFTYPRYALDFAFLRIYDESGQPMKTPHHFTWSQEGVEAGDLIFVIGNPGSTSRLATVAQLKYFRDVLVKHSLRALNHRLAAFRAFYDEDPATGEAINLRNTIFGISNSQKAYAGRQTSLDDPFIIARRRDAERQFREAIEADAELRTTYAGVFDQLADLQHQRTELGPAYGAFRYLESGFMASATVRRAIYAYRYLSQKRQGASEEALAEIKSQLLQVQDWPPGLERRLLTLRLADFQYYFGAEIGGAQEVLQGHTPEAVAAALLDDSALASSAGAAQALDAGTLTRDDPALRFAAAFMPRYQDFQSASAGLGAQEQELRSALGRARFDVYGTAVPPDATFSPRITDGIVKGYEYNGTVAPPYTTFFGMYDHFYSYGPQTDWNLPERWRTPPPDLDLSTPLNFISTSDTIGGNSGSPAVTRELAIVGLNFDRNIEGLSRDYIYLPERGRNIMVDLRAVREALDVMYDADRIVLELTSGRLVPTEADADAAMEDF